MMLQWLVQSDALPLRLTTHHSHGPWARWLNGEHQQVASLAASVALSDALGLLADADALRTAEVLVNKRLALIQDLQVCADG